MVNRGSIPPWVTYASLHEVETVTIRGVLGGGLAAPTMEWRQNTRFTALKPGTKRSVKVPTLTEKHELLATRREYRVAQVAAVGGR
jgi:hypothetical protein